MRTLLLLLLMFSNTLLAFSQTPQKQVPSQKQTIPSKNEIQSSMNEATDGLRKELADLKKQLKETTDPKEKESLQDQISMLEKQLKMIGGLNKSLSAVSDKTIQQGLEEEAAESAVPKKDVTRIRMLPEKILSEAELVIFVKNVHAEVEKLINSKDKIEAQKIYSALKADEKSSDFLNNIASSIWLGGYPEIALYILGKECTANMKNTNNLNNYAAFLTMAGGEHAALPILQALNKKLPGNSTILNNIGQAWFGLGDINNAKKYLDNTMHAYGLHSQANQTMCLIQESEGNTEEAIESIKRSIEENYTAEKEAKLNKLGGKLEYDDIPFRYPAKAEPLGIEKFMFTIPAYPFESGVESEVSRMEWDDFRSKVVAARLNVENERRMLEPKIDTISKRIQNNPRLLKPYNTPPYKTAVRKLALLHEWYVERITALSKKMDAASDTIQNWKDELQKAYEALGYDPQNPDKNCGPIRTLATTFLQKANTLRQQRNAELLSLLKQKLNAEARLSLYGTYDESLYKLAIANIKLDFLLFLGNLHCEFQVGCIKSEVPKPKGKVLPDFDEMNCTYKDSIYIFPFTFMKFECNKMRTEFDISPNFNYREGLSPYIKLGWDENFNTGKITKANIEIGAEVGIDEVSIGPVKAESKIEGGIGVEISEHGVEEVFIKATSRGDVGPYTTHGEHSSPEGNYVKGAGVETKISWNAGSEKVGSHVSGELHGTGKLLSGIHIGGH